MLKGISIGVIRLLDGCFFNSKLATLSLDQGLSKFSIVSMTDILSVPAEFSTILVDLVETGTNHSYRAYGERRSVPRPPLGPFTHQAVQTFVKTCSEGQIDVNWLDHSARALEAWKSLSPEELSFLRQAADRDKQRYDERVELVGREGTEELLQLLEEKKLQTTGLAPSAFDLFKNSPETRSRLYDARKGSIDSHELYQDGANIWLWGSIDDEEKSHWRQEAQRRLDIRNNARKMKGEEAALLLDTEPQLPELAPSPGKRARSGPKIGPSEEDIDNVEVDEGEAEDDKGEADNAIDEAKDDDDSGNKAQSTDGEVVSVDDAALQWAPTEDQNLTPHEKQLLTSIPPNLHRWDRCPRAARNAYTLFYADRLTTAASPHFGKDPHCSTTRAQIHADWESTDGDTHQHYKNLAKTDKLEFDRQSEEHKEWTRVWVDLELRILLRKVIDRWRPHSSFEAGQHRICDIPRRHPQHRPDQPRRLLAVHEDASAVDYALPCLHYPVIRTDYSNGAVYELLRHILRKSSFFENILVVEMTFYDGLQSPSPSTPVEQWDALLSFAKDDPRAEDYEWRKSNLENTGVDDLKAVFGELAFHRKEHVPIYTFGGQEYALVIDSQSMKDGTIKCVALSIWNFLDSRPELCPRLDGSWEQDPAKEWYNAPRVQAVDVAIMLCNLEIANTDWMEYVQHRPDRGLDLFSDPKAQQWRGWQLAIEFVFGGQALEKVVGVLETEPYEACLPEEDDDE